MTSAEEPESLEIRMNDAGPTMFGAPRWDPDGAYDVVFVGVPTDAGGLGHRSPAAAPAFLRSTSTLFPLTRDAEGVAVGWFDYVWRRDILRGVRMADAGDLPCARGRGLEPLRVLPKVYEALRETTRLLVVLGGDHSIAYFLPPALRGEGLVWLDAHEDASPKQGPLPDCANVVSYLDEVDDLRAIAQVGLRGLVPADRRPPPPKRRICRSADEVVTTLRDAGVSGAAVSVDVDVFDPGVLPAVGSAMPGGMREGDALDVLRAVRRAGLDVPVLELAEFAPISDNDVTSALFLVNFLLRAASIALEADGGPR